MNPNTMTIDDIRDELARREGWKHYIEETWLADDGCESLGHPIPATLDEAAKLPEGWGYEVSCSNWWTDLSGNENHVNKKMYQAIGHRLVSDYAKYGEAVVMEPCDTELLARFRLRLACTLADDNSTQH